MKYIEESSIFTEDVLLLTLDTPVKGYDGTEIGPANEQAQALANRTLWLKNKLSTMVPPDLTVVDVELEKSHHQYNYPTPTPYHFDYTAKAFKDTLVSEKRTVPVNYSSGSVDIKQSAFPSSDDQGFFIDKRIEGIELAEISGGEDVEKYKSDELNDDLIEGTLISLAVEKGTNDIVPTATKNEVGEFTIISSPYYSGYEPWRAFQAPLKESEQTTVPDHQYWSFSQRWRDKKSDAWLGVQSNTPFEITGYSFQNFEKLYWSSSTVLTAWELQGRNSDDDAWETLDHQVDQTIMNTDGGWSTYFLPQSVTYSQYRILIEDVLVPASYPSIARLQFLVDPSILIKDTNGDYLTISDDNTITPISNVTADSFKESGFRNITAPIKLADLESHLPIELVSLMPGKVDIQLFKTAHQISIDNPLQDTGTWEGLTSINVTDYVKETDETDIKVAFTVDNKNYVVFKDEAWVEIGMLDLTEESAKVLIEKGNYLNSISEISTEQWQSLLETVAEKDTVFGIAYSKSIVNKKDSIIPNEIEFSFGEIRYWKQMSLDKVEISITEKYITFKPLEKGNYKFCYRFN